MLEDTAVLFMIAPTSQLNWVEVERLNQWVFSGGTLILVQEQNQAQRLLDRFDIRDVNLPVIGFDVDCSKGTYIRTLSEDLGKKVGSAAHLSALSRTKSGKFELSRAHELEEILALDTASVAGSKSLMALSR